MENEKKYKIVRKNKKTGEVEHTSENAFNLDDVDYLLYWFNTEFTDYEFIKEEVENGNNIK